MDPLNILGVDTPRGYRTFELFCGDITALEGKVDVLVVSSFAGSYSPTPGTLPGALFERLGIDLRQLAQRPALDMRIPLGTWLSEPLAAGPFGRILCVEIVGGRVPAREAITNVFVSLSLLEAKGWELGSVALPLLGTGAQGLSPELVIEAILRDGARFLDRSVGVQRITFVERDRELAQSLAGAMDAVLGRVRSYLPQSDLSNAVRQDIQNKLLTVKTLFQGNADEVRSSWLALLQAAPVRSVELGVLSRKLVELMLDRLACQPGAQLWRRIAALEQEGVAPWVCGYMHVLRHMGNESAHENRNGQRQPPAVDERDLTLALFCVERLLDYWIQYRDRTESPADARTLVS